MVNSAFFKIKKKIQLAPMYTVCKYMQLYLLAQITILPDLIEIFWDLNPLNYNGHFHFQCRGSPLLKYNGVRVKSRIFVYYSAAALLSYTTKNKIPLNYMIVEVRIHRNKQPKINIVYWHFMFYWYVYIYKKIWKSEEV